MINFLGGFFVAIFGEQSWLATIIISMFPLVELKGGIPIGMSIDFWGDNALNGTMSFLFALLGSCLVVPILALVFSPIIAWLKRTKVFKKLGELIDEKVKNHSKTIEEKSDDEKSSAKKVWTKCLLLFAFVAVPLPLTGVWTGTCVGVAIGLKFWQTVVSVVLGNIVAGIIITTICAIFPQFTTILVLIFLAIIAIMIIYGIIKWLIAKRKNKAEDVE